MAKLPSRGELTTVSEADKVHVVDVDDFSSSPKGTSKYAEYRNLKDVNYKATGVLTGGTISATLGTLVFNISAGSGIIWDAQTTTETPVVWADIVNEPITVVALSAYIGLSLVGTVVQSPVPFTIAQQKTIISLGRIDINTGVIGSYSNEGMNLLTNNGSVLNTIKNFLAGKSFTSEQVKHYPNGANLFIRRTAGVPPTLENGVVMSQGAGRDKGIPETPDLSVIVAYDQTPLQYVWLDNLGNPRFEVPGIVVDTANYQNGGTTLAPVPAGKFTVQWFVSLPTATVVIYGTKIYDSFFVAQRSMVDQRIPTILKILADALESPRNFDNSLVTTRLVIKSGETSLVSSETLLLNFDEETDAVFVDNINRGIISDFNVVAGAGLNFSYSDGQVFDQPKAVPFSIAGAALVASDNAINYLYWDQSAQLPSLSLSTSPPGSPDVLICEIYAQCGVIYDIVAEPTIVLREANLVDAQRELHPSGGFKGMVVRADPTPTSLLFFQMTSGTFVNIGDQFIQAAGLLSQTTPLIRHFHTAGAPVCDTSTDADPAYYDNLTDRTLISPSSQWKADLILYTTLPTGGKLHYVYGQTLYGNQASAQAGATSIATNFPGGLPAGLEDAARLFAVVLQGSATTLPISSSPDWIDYRTSEAGGVGGATTFTGLEGTPNGFVKAFAGYRVSVALNAIEESPIILGDGIISTSAVATFPATTTQKMITGIHDLGSSQFAYDFLVIDQSTTARDFRWFSLKSGGSTSTLLMTLNETALSLEALFDLTVTGTLATNNNLVTMINEVSGASIAGTENTLLFRQAAATGDSGTIYDHGKITFGAADAWDESVPDPGQGHHGYLKITGIYDSQQRKYMGISVKNNNPGENYNISLGIGALQSNDTSTGDANITIGYEAAKNLTTSSLNVLIGQQVSNGLVGGSGFNVCIGSYAGAAIVNGSSNVCLGYGAGPSTLADFSNRLYINNTNSDTPLIYGDFTTNEVQINDSLKVNGRFAAKVLNLNNINYTLQDETFFTSYTNTGNKTLTIPAPTNFAGRVVWLNNSPASTANYLISDGVTTYATVSAGQTAILFSDGSFWVAST